MADYEDQDAWMRKTLINIANAGTFSSDRTISQYNDDLGTELISFPLPILLRNGIWQHGSVFCARTLPTQLGQTVSTVTYG